MLSATVGAPPGDPARSGGPDAFSAAFLELFTLVCALWLWVVLGILLILGASKGGMPRPARALARILHPLAGVSVGFAIDLSFRYPGGWSILLPALLPALIAFYGLWACLPALHGALRAGTTSAVALGTILALALAVIPLGHVDRLQASVRAAKVSK